MEKLDELSQMVIDFYTKIDSKQYTVASNAIDFYADAFTDNNRSPLAPEEASDKEVMANLFSQLAQGFPDGKHALDIVAPIDEDRVMVYWTYTGTQKGEFFGVPASGNAVSINGVDIFRVKDGKFVEQWHIEQLMSLFSQIEAS